MTFQLFGMVEMRATAHQGGIPLREGSHTLGSYALVSTKSDNFLLYMNSLQDENNGEPDERLLNRGQDCTSRQPNPLGLANVLTFR